MKLEVRKSFLAITVLYGIIFVSLSYWQLCADLKNHPANPRYYQMFQEDRGVIYDRKGIPLAISAADSEGEFYARSYAATSVSHVVGYFHQRYGMTGLERLYHEDLSLGRSLLTTLDLEIQNMAAQALEGLQGAVVVMKPATGEILALVSSPGIDGSALDANWSDYLGDARSPFLNRATHGLYPPGSILKPVVYGAALREQLVERSELWQDQGSLVLQNRVISNAGGRAHGTITTDRALAVSSNVVFAQLAISLGERLLDEFRSVGLGAVVPFDLQNLRGNCPASIHSDYDAAQMGIGQGELLVTPLQMAVIASTIANDGVMVKPFVVQEVRGGLRLRQITRPQEITRVWPASIGTDLREAMVLAATEGTAQSKLAAPLAYGGKTGTAQIAQGHDHAWFIGFAPTKRPEVAIAVLIEHGGSGSQVAVPIGTRLLAAALGIDQ